MPLIATSFENDIRKMPVDFHELIAGPRPRPFVLACYAEKDDDFSASGVRHVLQGRAVYKLYNSEMRLQSIKIDAGHSFPKCRESELINFLPNTCKPTETKQMTEPESQPLTAATLCTTRCVPARRRASHDAERGERTAQRTTRMGVAHRPGSNQE